MSTLHFNHSMLIQEDWGAFTETDHTIWRILFENQSINLKKWASPEVTQGSEKLKICQAHIPKFSELNKILQEETGFSIVPVKGFIPEDLFFRFLSKRMFPSTCFIRDSSQLEYLQEPDIFHDIFGHVPLLVNPVFADFMQESGHKGLEAKKYGLEKFAAALYWFTVEFGLIATSKGTRVFGAGLLSSKGESLYALESDKPVRLKFNLRRVMKTQYHIDSFQKTYFVIQSFEDLFRDLGNLDWSTVQDTCEFFPEIAQGISLNRQETIL